jgi:hypothetical protein
MIQVLLSSVARKFITTEDNNAASILENNLRLSTGEKC